jgi:hypothetical protein
MSLPIISAEQRRAEKRGVKMVILGVSGIGKTTQLKSLSTESTLFVDLEAGDLAVADWNGDTIRPRTWPEFRDLVVYLAGPNPALPPETPFSQAHFEHVCQLYGDPVSLAKYQTYFCDSITALSRLFHLGQVAAGSILGAFRQAGQPRCLRSAWSGNDYRTHASATCTRQERGVRFHPRREAGRLQSQDLHATNRGFKNCARIARHR